MFCRHAIVLGSTTDTEVLPQIPPTTTEAILNNKFRPCGPIEDISIRCTAGAAVMIGHPQPYRTTRYATIMFTREKALKKALELNGSEIHGVKIIVS